MKRANLLDQLLIFRNLLQDPLIRKVCDFFDSKEKTPSGDLIYDFISIGEQLGLDGNLFSAYLVYRIALDENALSKTAEKTGGQIGPSITQAALHDLALLKEFINQEGISPLISDYKPTIPAVPSYHKTLETFFLSKDSTVENILEGLIAHYVSYGYGELANYKAFRWNKEQGLQGIAHCDPIRLEDLVGYERQKNTLIKNTQAFLNGNPAYNILLAGDRGTGKSSSVKALINHYFTKGLRVVEVSKQNLPCFHEILQTLREKGKKFIIFLDDLSFEEFEIEYKHLKSVMEGGIEAKPANVLIYATSNRRHLIRENWSDRNDDPEDIHRFDTMNEKISLSDRFGIILTYISPNQEEYLKIVRELAVKEQITLAEDQLFSEALKWERAHAGRSGRTARHFIMSLTENQKQPSL